MPKRTPRSVEEAFVVDYVALFEPDEQTFEQFVSDRHLTKVTAYAILRRHGIELKKPGWYPSNTQEEFINKQAHLALQALMDERDALRVRVAELERELKRRPRPLAVDGRMRTARA